MIHNLPEQAYRDILRLARKYDVSTVVLFGSRARGDHWDRSDIDLAIWGGNTRGFALDADEPEYVRTLLFIDVVEMERPVQPELREAILREGVALNGELQEGAG